MAKSKLGKRERLVVTVGVACLVLMASSFFVNKARGAYKQTQKQLDVATTTLQDAQNLQAIIDAERSGHRAIQDRIKARPRGFALYSFATRCLNEVQLTKRAQLETDKRGSGNLEGVRLKLTGVSMEELTDFLHKIYASNNLVVVQKLEHLKASADGKGLDCLMTLMMPRG